jgi:hypothetical protein
LINGIPQKVKLGDPLSKFNYLKKEDIKDLPTIKKLVGHEMNENEFYSLLDK